MNFNSIFKYKSKLSADKGKEHCLVYSDFDMTAKVFALLVIVHNK